MRYHRLMGVGCLMFVICMTAYGDSTFTPGRPYMAPAATPLIAGEIQKPDDLIALLPFLSMIPKTYLFTGNYKMKLTRHELRIDHIATDTRCTMQERICMVSLGYAQPVNQNLGSTFFELPIFSSDGLITNHWEHGSMGDYVLHLTDTPLYSPSIRIQISARFN